MLMFSSGGYWPRSVYLDILSHESPAEVDIGLTFI